MFLNKKNVNALMNITISLPYIFLKLTWSNSVVPENKIIAINKFYSFFFETNKLNEAIITSTLGAKLCQMITLNVLKD